MVEREFTQLELNPKIQSAVMPAKAGVACRILLLLSIFTLNTYNSRSYAQWRPLITSNFQFTSIYFLDLPGPPRIGFAGGGGDSNFFKTTDGGYSWVRVIVPPLAFIVTDMEFKESL